LPAPEDLHVGLLIRFFRLGVALHSYIWQESLEDISYLLRIPQRKPYGSMEGDVKKSMKVNCLSPWHVNFSGCSSELRVTISWSYLD
jgi:hypothetical protein